MKIISFADYICILFILLSIIVLIYHRSIKVHTVINTGNVAVNQTRMSPTSLSLISYIFLETITVCNWGCSDFKGKIRIKLTSTFPQHICSTIVLIMSKLYRQFQCEELIVQKMCTLNIPMQVGARQFMVTPHYKSSTENKML